MLGPRRRFWLSAATVCAVVLAVVVLRVAWSWKRALDNVNVMIVPTLVLPTAPAIGAAPEQGIHQNNAPEPQPTAEVAQAPDPTFAPEVEAPDAPVNILLLGTDARIGDEVSRTDAVIIVRVDPRTDKVSLLSLPRDLWVTIPGYGKARVNAAYPIGEKQIGTGYGPALAKKTVSDLLKIPIHHFMLINFEGFKELIDQVGGVYINVPKPIDDPAYPTDNYGVIKVHFDAGRQFMDSDRALIYARTRHADNDFGRNQRQQQVLLAIFDRMRAQGILSQLTALDGYTAALRDYIRTDLSRDDMLSLASLGPRLSASNIQRLAIEPKMLVTLKEPATFAAEPKALRQLVAQMLDSSSSSAGGTKPVQ